MRKSGLVSLIGISGLVIGLLIASLAVGNSPLLGLDLQGGVEVVLRPAEDQVVTDEALDSSAEIIRRRIDSLGVAEPDVTRQGSNLVVQLPGVDDQQRAVELIGQTGKLEFRPVHSASNPVDPDNEEQLRILCRNIVIDTKNWIVPQDTVVSLSSSYSVETIREFNAQIAAAVEERDLAIERGEEVPLLPQCAGVDLSTPASTTTTAPTTTTTTTVPTTTTTEAPENEPDNEDVASQNENGEESGEDTAGETEETDTEETEEPAPVPEIDSAYSEYLVNRSLFVTDPQNSDPDELVIYIGDSAANPGLIQKYILGPALLDGSALRSASAQLSGVATWSIQLNFRSGEEGIDLFNSAALICSTRQPLCPLRQLGIALDGSLESSPEVAQANFDPDNIAIQGSFSRAEAMDLALVLRSGALPLEFDDPVSAGLVRSVSATLGNDSLRAGIIAGSIGILLVALYMIFYYRLVGLAAMLSLAISGVFLWVIVSFLSETQGLALTLAGITGLIVSIGVSLDSNVVYFEHLKEDIQNGKTLRSSTDQSFPIAFKTIFWANLATLIGAVILWWLAIGSVRGFAAILGIASVLDLVATYFFLRPAVKLLAHSKMVKSRPKWLIGVNDNAPA